MQSILHLLILNFINNYQGDINMEILSFIKIQNDLTKEEFIKKFKIKRIGFKLSGDIDYILSDKDGTEVIS